jgi:hypothetical protein
LSTRITGTCRTDIAADYRTEGSRYASSRNWEAIVVTHHDIFETFLYADVTFLRIRNLGLLNDGHDIAEPGVDGTAGVLAEHDYPAAAIGKLNRHAVKHDGTFGELAVDTFQAIWRIAEIKLDTAYQNLRVLQADGILDGYDLTWFRWLVVAAFLDQVDFRTTDRLLISTA